MNAVATTAEDRIVNVTERLHDDAKTIKDWFCGKGRQEGYDLTVPAHSSEMVKAMDEIFKTSKRLKFVDQYFSDLNDGLCENLADFFFYYGCNTQCANELSYVISEFETPLAYDSLHDFCLVQANEIENDRAEYMADLRADR